MKNHKSSGESIPLRPILQLDEWTETYLGRVARSNGVARPWRNDLDLVRPLLPATSMSRTDGVPRYGELELPRWATVGRAAQIRYCPACLADSFHIRARWRLPMFEVCTLHNVRLKTGLVEPAVTGGYKTPGRRLVSELTLEEAWADSICPMQDERLYTRAVWGPFEQAVVRQTATDDICRSLAWALLTERLIDAVVIVVRGPGYPRRDLPRSTHRAQWLMTTGLMLSATSEGLLGFLKTLLHPARRRAASSCLDSLLASEAHEPTILSLLPLQGLRDRMMAAAPETGMIQACGALPRRQHPEDFVSLDRAEALVGCTPGILTHLVREKVFSSVRTVGHGRKKYVFIHQSEVEVCRRWFSSLMSCEQVTAELQIDRRGYLVLLDAGHLRPLHIASRGWHNRQVVAALLNRLDDVARAFPERETSLQPLFGEWMFRRGRPRSILIQIVNEIVRGELPLFRKLGEPGLLAYYVDQATIERLRWLAGVSRRQSDQQSQFVGQLSLLDA